MKKLFYLMSLCALAVISCQKEELADNSAAEGGYVYTFVGTHAPEVKASIGDKNEQNKWPILWEAGDKLGVYDSGNSLVGVAELAGESVGQNQGTFTVTATRELVVGEALTLKYPYSETVAYVPTKQTQATVSSSAGLGANAVATATTTYVEGNTVFALSHANAYVRFELSSEEFKDYTLNGVTLWSKGEKVSGAAGAEQDYVKATLQEPVVLGTDAKYIWMTANSVDLTNKDFYAIVHMTKGIETVTLPVSLKGKGQLTSHSVTTIKLPKLVKSLAPDWYEPIETRYIAANGEGWCYGDENTVVFTNMKDSKIVDLKARGNFMKVTEPKHVRVKYLNGVDECSSPKGVSVDGTVITTYDKTGTETFSIANIGSSYSISVILDNHRFLSSALGSVGYISGMEILDKDNNVIWGINLWLRLKPMSEIAYKNGVIMDRNLGSDELGNAGSWRPSGHFFQWGRPFALQGNGNAYSKKYFTSAEATAVTSLDVSAANPYTMYYYAKDATYKDWYYGDGTTSRENDLDDLWGNPNAGWENRGVKSIYDPCPDGWMVASPAVIKEVIDGLAEGAIDQTTYTGGTYPYFTHKGAHWLYAGGFTCDGNAGGVNFKKIGQLFAYWSNTNHLNHGYGRCMYTSTYASAPEKFDTQYSKARAFPIRCMKDTENR